MDCASGLSLGAWLMLLVFYYGAPQGSVRKGLVHAKMFSWDKAADIIVNKMQEVSHEDMANV